jgi:LAO/AO transport system kinase
MNDLVDGVLAGKRRAVARLLTQVENAREGADQALAALFPHTGRAWIIGITGAPGTGKSSLVNILAKAYRDQQKTVGIIAVDPTSPFSGGAILGDRIRMHELAGDAGVFIRSMAARSHLGGLARTTHDAVRVLDAAGFEIILVETVGAGQSEVDIVRTAQTTIVVQAPGLGDDIQANKAGILEIADILVVNKADRPGADNTVRNLKAMLEIGHPTAQRQLVNHHGQRQVIPPSVNGHEDAQMWLPPVIRTIAIENDNVQNGIDEIIDAVARHRQHLTDANLWQQQEQQYIQLELMDRLQVMLMECLFQQLDDVLMEDIIGRIQARELDLHQAAQEILARAEQHAE